MATPIPNLMIIFFQIVITSIILCADPAKSDDCPTSYCGINNLSIHYPFWSQDQDQQLENCSLSGFNLSCNTQQKPILNIPNSGDFYVSSIYYFLERITLYDPNNCLAKRLLRLNLSSSPFKPVSHRNYTFLSCPRDQVSNSTYAIECLSNSSTVVLATRNQMEIRRLSSTCKKNKMSLLIPVSTYNDYRLPENLELKWNKIEPPCIYCDAEFSPSEPKVKHTLYYVVPFATIPLFLICVCCRLCMSKSTQDNQHTIVSSSSPTTLPLTNSVASGFDQTIIRTYEKITVGESRRISGPNDGTCAICLAEYVPKDTLRFMPICEHCFHVECIDKWLSVNKKCPICRT